MRKIKPVFDTLCSKSSLMRVLNGSSQNPNEGFHSFIWNMSPKHKSASEVTFNIACYLATLIFNDGYHNLGMQQNKILKNYVFLLVMILTFYFSSNF
jgi:hypothetical protein